MRGNAVTCTARNGNQARQQEDFEPSSMSTESIQLDRSTTACSNVESFQIDILTARLNSNNKRILNVTRYDQQRVWHVAVQRDNLKSNRTKRQSISSSQCTGPPRHRLHLQISQGPWGM